MRRSMDRPLATLAMGMLLAVAVVAPVTAQEESASPEPPVVTTEVITLGATNEVLRDGFDLPGAWGTADDEAGAIQYDDGTLRFVLRKAPNAKWNWLDLGREAPVLWVRAALDLRGKGGAGGPMCGTDSTPPVHIFGLVSTDGEWIMGRASGNELGVYERGPLPAHQDLSKGGAALVSLECAMTGPAGDRVAMWIDGINVADITIPDSIGPFTNAGLYGEGYDAGFRVIFDEVVAATGEVYSPVIRGPGSPPLELAGPATAARSARRSRPPVSTFAGGLSRPGRDTFAGARRPASPSPEASAAPAETPSPEVSAAPAETASPEVSPSPEASPAAASPAA